MKEKEDNNRKSNNWEQENELEENKGVELRRRKRRRGRQGENVKKKKWQGKGEGLRKRRRRSRNTDKFINPYNVRHHIWRGKTDRHRTIHLACNKELMWGKNKLTWASLFVRPNSFLSVPATTVNRVGPLT